MYFLCDLLLISFVSFCFFSFSTTRTSHTFTLIMNDEVVWGLQNLAFFFHLKVKNAHEAQFLVHI